MRKDKSLNITTIQSTYCSRLKSVGISGAAIISLSSSGTPQCQKYIHIFMWIKWQCASSKKDGSFKEEKIFIINIHYKHQEIFTQKLNSPMSLNVF